MAKQLGVSEQALAGLQDPGRYPFPPDQKAALLFADAMTRSSGQVSDEVFGELRRHFDEPQTVEIACVVGLFNYFNRFNNALNVEVTLMDPDVLVHRVEDVAAAAGSAAELCDRVGDLLKQGRRYARVAIRRGSTGSIGETKVSGRKLEVPIRTAAGVVGVIEVESDHEAGIDAEERSLVERVAAAIALKVA